MSARIANLRDAYERDMTSRGYSRCDDEDLAYLLTVAERADELLATASAGFEDWCSACGQINGRHEASCAWVQLKVTLADPLEGQP